MELQPQNLKVTYHVSLNEVRTILAEKLAVPVEQVTVNYRMRDVSREQERWPRYEVCGVEIVVNKGTE